MAEIESIIAQMTLEEKAALCTGATSWTLTPIERLGVPGMFVSDGPHGVRRVANEDSLTEESLPATCFPTASCLASTWDTALIHEMGQALAEECIALNVDVVLGPGVNMKRTPVCGRNFEYFSEDPYFAGEMAASYINGVQSRGVGTSLKHYAVNNQEYQRMTISAEVDERTLREIYLPAFETAVKKAQPWTVMCSYNRINGVYGSEQTYLLTEILKGEWELEGFVVSDWGAVHDRVAALKAGLDLEMPGPRARRVQAVIDAVQSGAVDMRILDEAVRRILRIVFKAAETPKGAPFDAAAHHALVRRIAGEGMILLKNNGILPLKGVKRIAVIGQAVKEPHFQGGGSSHINPTQVDIPLDELAKLAGGAEISFSQGYPPDDSSQPALIEAAVAAAQAAEVALLYIALPTYKESEGYDRADLDLTAQQVALIKAVCAAQPNSVVILNNGSAVTMSDWIAGPAAVLEAWMMGQAGGGAIADVLFGVVNPSGKLTETFPLKLTDTPAFINYPGVSGKVRYGEGLFIGYRYYEMREQPVLFPFGYGGSYTTFAYSALRVSAQNFRDVDGLTVSVEVTNTGSVAGKEIVQVYVHQHQAQVVRPLKELKGFAKVELQPGETKTVTVPLDFRAFAYYHPAYGRWITESGEFDILVGASSADIRCTETVTLESTVELPCLLNRKSTLREWLDDPRGKPVFEPFFNQMLAGMRAMFGGGEEEGGIGMDVMGFLLDMPLRDVLEFQGNLLPMSADDIVAGLLKQVFG
ncbi:MAG: glycoside hydrolase family 3 C-terminal domain-containing protein [Anaerolineae bacterium]|nr:glycoside hydrolase family 3 C-terminal domain-containing protein [Anaerolineae bacterium]